MSDFIEVDAQRLAAMAGGELFDFAKQMGVMVYDTPTREQILARLARLAR